jgi:hypothetical protein
MLLDIFHTAGDGLRVEGKLGERTAECLIRAGLAKWRLGWWPWWRRMSKRLFLAPAGRTAAEKLNARVDLTTYPPREERQR